MGFLEEQIQNLSINIRNHFPELGREIQSINKNIEIANLLKIMELNDKNNFLNAKERSAILNQLKQEINQKYVTDGKKKIKKFWSF